MKKHSIPHRDAAQAARPDGKKSLTEFAARRPRMNSDPFLAAVYTSQKILCAGLGSKVLASADLTVDVGPVKARREAKPPYSKGHRPF